MSSNIRHRATKVAANAAPRQSSRSRINAGAHQSSWEIASDDDSNSLRLEPRRNYPLHRDLSGSKKKDHIAAPRSSGFGRDERLYSYSQDIMRQPASSNFSSMPSNPTSMIPPDSRYDEFLSRRRKKKKSPPIFHPICCAKFCAFFSWVALSFLLFVGILLDTQPMYIKGVLPQHLETVEGSNRAKIFYVTMFTERLDAASHAYQAAFAYALTMLFSLGYVYNWGWWIKSWWRRYQDIPDTDSTVPDFHTGAGDSDDATGMATQAYQSNAGLPTKAWNFISFTLSRIGMLLVSSWQANQKRPRRRAAGTKDV